MNKGHTVSSEALSDKTLAAEKAGSKTFGESNTCSMPSLCKNTTAQ